MIILISILLYSQLYLIIYSYLPNISQMSALILTSLQLFMNSHSLLTMYNIHQIIVSLINYNSHLNKVKCSTYFEDEINQ